MAKDKIAMTRNDLERYGARLKAKRGVTRKQAASKLKKIMIALRVAAKKLTRSGAGGVFKRSTGRLSRSIDYRVVGLTGYLTVGVVYGQIQNTGGIIKRHRIAPRHKKALAWGGTKRKRLFFSEGYPGALHKQNLFVGVSLFGYFPRGGGSGTAKRWLLL